MEPEAERAFVKHDVDVRTMLNWTLRNVLAEC